METSLADIAAANVAAAEIAGKGAQAALMTAGALELFQRLLPQSFFDQALAKAGIRQNNRVYSAAVVMWLMSSQRMNGGTLSTAVLELMRGLPASLWPHPCKRLERRTVLREANLSSHTGAYSQARMGLPDEVIKAGCDWASKQLMEQMSGIIPEIGQRAAFIDGTTIRAAYSPEMCEAYPPASNQHGESHWPIIRLLVLHDLVTGLAMKPAWGPVNGENNVSEQSLVEKILDSLPAYTVLVADCNFGVFSVAYAADQNQHPIVFRLTAGRAQCLYNRVLKSQNQPARPLHDGIDLVVEWKPSRSDGKSQSKGKRKRKGKSDGNSESKGKSESKGCVWPDGAMVKGRLIVRQVQPSDGKQAFLLALFTTLMEVPAEVIADLYGKRWDIETDLRTLKQTLRMDELTCLRPEMVEKEIPIAVLAYNLVRALAFEAAQQAGLTPRDFSFTQVRNVANAFLPAILAASTEEQAEKLARDMMYYIGQARLYRRKRRTYPRAVWPKPKSFPLRH